MQKIIPNLWFDDKAEEAIKLYTSIFKNSKIKTISHYSESSSKVSGRKNGSVMTIEFELNGQEFLALNGGPIFSFTPAISFIVHCEKENDVDELFKKLSKGGEILMPLDKYPFSEKYAFIKDKFGLSWQIMLSNSKLNIVPSLLFVGENFGKAEDAVKFYTKIFKNSNINNIMHYGKNENGEEGTLKFSSFIIEKQEFAAMDGPGKHNFTFNESISFIVFCENQKEIDYYWNKLSAVPKSEICGWLKDKFGISWQIVPAFLGKMIGDKEKSEKVMQEVLKMKKLDIKKLQKAYEN